MNFITAALVTLSMSCWEDAADRYQLPVELIQAMASVESSMNPNAVAHADNGTYSIGLMQINSSWFEQLEDMGISEPMLYDACVSIHVGSWILAQEVQRYGYTWEAIGAYYAGAYSDDSKHWKIKHYREYADKVLGRWADMREGKSLIPPTQAEPVNVVYVGGLGTIHDTQPTKEPIEDDENSN